MADSDALLVFARAPEPGQVKTRLIPQFGPEMATEIYRELLHTALNAALASSWQRVQIWCTPDGSDSFFTPYRRQSRVSLHCQCNGDLGQRMAHACKVALKDADRIALMGTDCPTLDSGILNQVWDRLRGDCDLVMVPAEDGGYVLLAMRQICPGIFEGVDWGTSKVAEQTRARCADMRLRCVEMATLRDIDTPEDVRHWRDGSGLQL